MMPTMPDMIALDGYDFWTLKCVNSGERHRRGQFRIYECRVIHDGKVYRSTAKTLANAVFLTLNKVGIKQPRGRLPSLKLVGGTP